MKKSLTEQYADNATRPNIMGGATGSAQEQEQVQKGKTRLVAVSNEAFAGTVENKLITTHKLMEAINDLFSGGFDDYIGGDLAPDQTGNLQLILYFRCSDGTGDVFTKPVVSGINKRSSIQDRISAFNNRGAERKFEITQDGKDVMEEFIFHAPGTKINWGQVSTEIIQSNYNGYQIFTKVTNLNLKAIVAAVYGREVEMDGQLYKYDYQISIVRPVAGKNFLLSIQRLNDKEVQEVCREMGFVQTSGSIQMVRARNR